MVTSVIKGKTLEEYLAVQPDGEGIYELEHGEWILMPPESNRNQQIAMFLALYFAQLGITARYLRMNTEIAVAGAQVAVRVPDLMVLSEEAVLALEDATRATIMLHMPAPELVVEVVSPGKEGINRDYRQKRSQYQARAIAEYWIVDPLADKVTILSLNEWLYDEAVFSGSDALSSPWLQRHKADNLLTVAELLQKA
ncbi:MAG: Uma2 family endonuclease [Limnothrix sp. RL_2_0]|nr:Uma2 family endonuclease [Limnothrix sp. RL_2_0]